MCLRLFSSLATVWLAVIFLYADAFAQTMPELYVQQIEEVTLYPDSAKLEIREKAVSKRLESGETVLTVYLPGHADPDSLSVQVNGKLTGVNVETLNKNDQRDPILAPWKDALQYAENERDVLKAELEAVSARIAMWQKPAMPRADVASELTKLDQAMQAGLKAANDRLLELTPLIAAAEEKVAIAAQQLEQLPPSYKVDLVLAKLRQNSEFTYSYMLRGCGWRPSYTVNARPKADKVDLIFSARLHQHSGFDWKDARIKLATNAPAWNITPPALDRWQIRQIQPHVQGPVAVSAAPQQESSVRLKAAGAAPVADYNAVYAEPQEIVYTTYSIWDMGKRTLLDDKPTLMAVSEESLAAKFYYTVRPKVSNQAYLTAELIPDQQDENTAEKFYPQSTAVFMVEGNSVGSGNYPPSVGDELFFGTSPLIKVSCVELGNLTDEKGFMSKTQTHNWHWKFEVENQSGKSIDVLVEDSLPVLADARMELKQSSVPAAEVDMDKQMYFWQTRLEPKAKYEIEHKVNASAPADVGISSTR